MKIWAKYLTIGWFIVCVAIVIVSFQLMKSHFVEEDYEVMMVYKVPEKMAATDKFTHDWEAVAENLFYNKDVFDTISITKKEFVDRMKKAKGVTIESKTKIKDKSVYLLLPLYAFAVWTIPILVFSLVGLLFSRKTEPK
jgi:hypothetical protein